MVPSTGTKTRLSDQLLSVALTEEEVELANALLGRVSQLAAAAVEKRVKLMIDAEHTYFQPVSSPANGATAASITKPLHQSLNPCINHQLLVELGKGLADASSGRSNSCL
jgi:hypothetical protein